MRRNQTLGRPCSEPWGGSKPTSSRSTLLGNLLFSPACSKKSKNGFTSAEKLRADRRARLEAVLFLAREPLSTRKLAQLANLTDGLEARRLLNLLSLEYNESGTAFQVEEIAGGFQLLTRPQFSPWLQKIHPLPQQEQLSGPTMETLAIVAYRQPVVRAEIEAIRGVQCGEILRHLLDRDLLRIAGRSSELGKPFLYGTTKAFLRLFGLKNLAQLPYVEGIKTTQETA